MLPSEDMVEQDTATAVGLDGLNITEEEEAYLPEGAHEYDYVQVIWGEGMMYDGQLFAYMEYMFAAYHGITRSVPAGGHL